MTALLRNAAAVCTVLAVTETLGRLAPKEKMVRFVRALAALALMASVLSAALSLDWDFSLSGGGAGDLPEDLTTFVEAETADAAGRDMERYLTGLLGAAGITAEKIEAQTTIREDGRIECTRVSAFFAYDSEARRALALLRNTLGEDVEVEVRADGR